MDEKSLSGLFDNLIPDDLAKALGMEPAQSGEEKTDLGALLKAAAGQVGGPLEGAIDEFLQGRGTLFKDASSALTRGIGITETKIVSILTSKFNLSPTMARLLAPMLIKILPEVLKEAESTPKKKKAKRKTTAKTTASSTSKKKKTTKKASTSKKTAASSTSKKKPTSSTSKKKQTASTKKKKTTKTATRSSSAAVEGGAE